MTSIPETNFKFSFRIEVKKEDQRWVWKILNHKNIEVAKCAASFGTEEECKNDLSVLQTSISEYFAVQ